MLSGIGLIGFGSLASHHDGVFRDRHAASTVLRFCCVTCHAPSWPLSAAVGSLIVAPSFSSVGNGGD